MFLYLLHIVTKQNQNHYYTIVYYEYGETI